MKNPSDNLQPFTSVNQPINKGAKKGSKQTTSVLKKLLTLTANKTIPKSDIKEEILTAAAMIFQKSRDKITNNEYLAIRAFIYATEGDFRYYKDIVDRTEGMTEENINIGNKDGEAFKQVNMIDDIIALRDKIAKQDFETYPKDGDDV